MKKSVNISDINTVNADGRQRVSAKVDGDLVWFDVPQANQVEARGEIFIAIALLEAMVSNLPITLDDDILVSPTLLKQLDELQDIYCCWNTDLTKVSVTGGTVTPSKGNGAVGCFYSGGVDGAYSFCKQRYDVTHLITLAGFDVISGEEQWQNLVLKNKKTATSMKVELVDVNNNFRQFSEKRKISTCFEHGLVLAGVAITLGFSKTFIPSSFTVVDLFPWGSHPLTDPLWSIEGREVVHYGANLSRSDKLQFLTDYPAVLDNLQVCWGHIDYNCGHCSKCLRTRAALYLLKANTKALEPLTDIRDLKKLSIDGYAGLPFMMDLMALSKDVGCYEILSILKGVIYKYLLRYHAEEFIKTLLGDKFTLLIKKLKGTSWQGYRVLMEAQQKP